MIFYNFNVLQQLCKEKNIILLKDYSIEKVNTKTTIKAKCLFEECDEEVNKRFRDIIISGCYCKVHSFKMKRERTISTNLKKYGVKNIFELDSIREKIKEKNDEIHEKIKKTNLEKYGVENPMQSTEIRAKMKKTCIERYGVEYPIQSSKIRNKITNTNLIKYGVEHPMQLKEIRNKMKEKFIEKYGVQYPTQLSEIRKKIIETNLRKYGVKNPMQLKEIMEKSKKTCLTKYGVENPSQFEKIKSDNILSDKYDSIKNVEKTKNKNSEINLKKRNDIQYFIEEEEIVKKMKNDCFFNRDIFVFEKTDELEMDDIQKNDYWISEKIFKEIYEKEELNSVFHEFKENELIMKENINETFDEFKENDIISEEDIEKEYEKWFLNQTNGN